MEKFLRFLLTLILLLLPLLIHAEDCDDLYRQGLRMRQTMTVQAQNQAIYLFQQAQACFTDSADIDRCARQIGLCENVIRRLGGTPVLDHNPAQAASDPIEEEPIAPEAEHADTTFIPDAPAPAEAPQDSVARPAAEATPEVAPAPSAAAPSAAVKANAEIKIRYDQTDPILVMTIDHAEEPTVKVSPAWLEVKIDPDGKVYFTAQKNKEEERNFTVIIVGKTIVYDIYVTQRPKKK